MSSTIISFHPIYKQHNKVTSPGPNDSSNKCSKPSIMTQRGG